MKFHAAALRLLPVTLLLATLTYANVPQEPAKPKKIACFYDFDKTLAHGTLFVQIQMAQKSDLFRHWSKDHPFGHDSEFWAGLVAKTEKLKLGRGLIEHLRRNKAMGVKNYIMTYGKVSDVKAFLENYPKSETGGQDLNELFECIYGTMEGQNINSLTDDRVAVKDVTFGIADQLHAHVGHTRAGWGYLSGYRADAMVGHPSINKGPYQPESTFIQRATGQVEGWAKWQRILYVMRRENIDQAVFSDDDKWNCNAAANGGFGYSTDSYYHDARDGTNSLAEQQKLNKTIKVVNVGITSTDNADDGKWFKEVESAVASFQKENKIISI